MISTQKEIGTIDGEPVIEVSLKNENGMEIRVINWGATVTHIFMPDDDGKRTDIVLGFDDLADYETNVPYFGAVCGRYANRIAGGQFTMDGETFQLAQNDRGNSLHGGERGFDKRMWTVNLCEEGMVEFGYLSPDGEEGYPGRIKVRVRYVLSDRDELTLSYFADSDRDTILNLTNHTYFNLAGEGTGTILNHNLKINASKFLPIDETFIPTGEFRSVKGSAMDFTIKKRVGAAIEADDPQLKIADGYDFNFAIDKEKVLMLAAALEDPASGRRMEVHTTEPGIQVYTANSLDGIKGKNGHVYNKNDAICLETQRFPDAPNQPNFPPSILKKGQEYFSITTYRFLSSSDM
jgi:aldose 1-epimerase